MCPWPRADFFQVNAIAVYRLMLEWLSCIFIFGQDHVATCIFASDVAAGVFFVVASCLEVSVLGKMLSWLLEGWCCLTSSTAKIYTSVCACREWAENQCGLLNLKMKVACTQRKIVRVSG